MSTRAYMGKILRIDLSAGTISEESLRMDWQKMKSQTYDLAERLLEYSVRIIKIVEQLPNTRAGDHVAGQLLRSETSPYSMFNVGRSMFDVRPARNALKPV